MGGGAKGTMALDVVGRLTATRSPVTILSTWNRKEAAPEASAKKG